MSPGLPPAPRLLADVLRDAPPPSAPPSAPPRRGMSLLGQESFPDRHPPLPLLAPRTEPVYFVPPTIFSPAALASSSPPGSPPRRSDILSSDEEEEVQVGDQALPSARSTPAQLRAAFYTPPACAVS